MFVSAQYISFQRRKFNVKRTIVMNLTYEIIHASQKKEKKNR